MDKVKIKFDTVKNVSIFFNGQHVEIIPHLSIENQIFLINTYTQTMFEPEGRNYTSISDTDRISAELVMVAALVDACTNIDVSNVDVNEIVSSGLYAQIVANIKNYSDFENLLNKVVSDITEQKKSRNDLSNLLAGLIERVTLIAETISTLDESKVEEIKNSALQLVKEFNESTIAKEVMIESAKEKTNARKSKKASS